VIMMGLDMWIEREIWPAFYDGCRLTIDSDSFTVDERRVRCIIENVCYWRKANAIHKWFVDNVQDGNDDCGRYRLTKKDIKCLLKTIEEAILSEEPWRILPTQEGFFFGSTEYDDEYYYILHETAQMLKSLLESWDEKSFYYYTSSW